MPRRIAFIMTGLLVAAGAVTAVAVTDPWGPGPESTQEAVVGASATTGPSASISSRGKDAEDVALVLSRLATDPASVAAKDMKDKVDPKVAVPPGSVIEPKPNTWAPDGLGGGTMTVSLTVPGEAPEKYLALMDKEVDGWKVSMTMLLNSAPTPSVAP
jgi:hypothetical protein